MLLKKLLLLLLQRQRQWSCGVDILALHTPCLTRSRS
jgi:hypothetical protein